MRSATREWRGRLADIVQQRAQRQRGVGWSQFFEQQQGVRPDVALGMEFGRLLDALHGGHFGQKHGQQAAFVEQFEAVSARRLR
jgi:hypothetical protein